MISLGEQTHANNLAVKITTDDGLEGWGECSPFLPINGESMETGLVVGGYLKTVLSGIDALDIENAHLLMDRTIYGNNSIKSAFDIALYDIAAQSAELPLYKFLGAKHAKQLITDYTISFGPAGEMKDKAEYIQSLGFRIIKIKLGGKPEEDIRRVRMIREILDSEIPLRLDANQGWSVDGAIKVLNAVSDCNVELCEEPIPRWQFMELNKVKQRSPIPIMADESCGDHHDAQRLVDLKACDSINIKLGKSGGLYKALKIIDIAESAGMPMQIGGFLESRIGFSASAHLAMTNELIRGIDFDTPLMFSEDPVEGGIEYGGGGKITLPETMGLGARLNL